MWLLSGFGDRKQYNTISANTCPHEEILYSLERHRLCEFNAILMGQNYKHLTELHPSSLSYLWAVGIWVIVKVGHPTGPIKISKNVIVLVEVFSDCAFIWEKLCDELMKIYMIKSVLLLKNPISVSSPPIWKW